MASLLLSTAAGRQPQQQQQEQQEQTISYHCGRAQQRTDRHTKQADQHAADRRCPVQRRLPRGFLPLHPRAPRPAFPLHYSGGSPTTGALVTYGRALAALRRSLANADEAFTPETLCAIYLVMISQLCAAGGMVSSFEFELLVSVCIPVIFEAISNPDIQIDLCFPPGADSCGAAAPPPPRTGKTRELEFPSLRLQRLARNRLCSDISSFFGGDMPASGDRRHPDARKLRRYQQFLSLYAMSLNFITVLNFHLRNSDPSDELLLDESHLIAYETIAIAQVVYPQRPLGSSYMPPSLAAVGIRTLTMVFSQWATINDNVIRAKTEELLGDYQKDLPHVQWMEQARWLERMLQRFSSRVTGRLGPIAPDDGDKVYVSIIHHKAAYGLVEALISF
ncbi:hypothetical protein BX600DRAFT_555512 [Xylariales sp. PMI_506]|nr:hypothetical protein BX600DRAFT_555512 [Xylariales sp. PMI_506]